MERDNFTCTECGDKKSTLNVHHWNYSKEPWDAKNEDLTTLCHLCHNKIEYCKDLTKDFLRQSDFRNLVLNSNKILIENKNVYIDFDCPDKISIYSHNENTDNKLSIFDRLILDAPDDIDYRIPLPLAKGFSVLRYDAPLPTGIRKSDLPNMASHCKQEECGSCYYEGVFVQWDEDLDERVLSFVMTIPPDISKSLIVVQEHKGVLGLIWRDHVPIGYEVDEWVENGSDGDEWIINSSWALVCNK